MNMEMLKELRKRLEYNSELEDEEIENLWELIDEAIARQSVTSEDVAEAIELLREPSKGMDYYWLDAQMHDALNLAITALQAYQLPSAIKWTGDNLREVINLIGWNESASSKWTWGEYEQVVKEKGLKIFTPDGSSMAGIGDWIVRDGNDCFVLQAYQPWIPVRKRLPESGKHVLLCCEVRPSGKRYVCDGYYANSKSITSGYSDECSNEYDEETDEYYLAEGYYEIIKNWGDYSSIAIDDFVVAWKPLPEPPKGE